MPSAYIKFMGSIRIASINICGLNNAAKRRRVTEDLRILKADSICFQETHISASSSKLMAFEGYQLILCTKQEVKPQGVAIFARRGIINVLRSLSDRNGRRAIIHCPVNDRIFT